MNDVDVGIGCVDWEYSARIWRQTCEAEELWAALGHLELLVVEILLNAVRVACDWPLFSRKVVDSVANFAGKIEEGEGASFLLGGNLCGHRLCGRNYVGHF